MQNSRQKRSTNKLVCEKRRDTSAWNFLATGYGLLRHFIHPSTKPLLANDFTRQTTFSSPEPFSLINYKRDHVIKRNEGVWAREQTSCIFVPKTTQLNLQPSRSCDQKRRRGLGTIMDKLLMSLTSINVLFSFSYCSQEPSESAAVERSSGLFDVNFHLFQNSFTPALACCCFCLLLALPGTTAT